MVKFLQNLWKVNGMVYPSLSELFCTTINVLHPISRQSMSRQ